MVVKTPPMGWNSWNTFADRINEEIVRTMADVMVNEGYLDAGYNYLVIDDCWALRERGADGRMVPDPAKFPNGMKAVADYVHSKGLKFGMYSCVGNFTCGGFPGSFEYEFIDAATLAEWGVDFLKLDYCYKPGTEPGARLYRRMALALENCGREILLSACSWGAEETHRWIKSTGASMWRSTGDVFDTWSSVRDIYNIQKGIYEYNGAGCFNDMDMLVVGMYGKGHVGLDNGLTLDEYRTHFSMWAFFGSPLMMGSDIRGADDDIKSILLNKDVIAVDQDPAYRQPYNVNGADTWARHMANGDIVLAVFNVSDNDGGYFIPFCELGLGRVTGRGLRIRNLWTGEDLGVRKEQIAGGIKAHSTVLLRCEVVEL